MVDFSVVVPVYNEVGNLPRLHQEVHSVMKTMGSYEIIYVNDGSTDGSLEVLKDLKGRIIVDLQRNYGQSVAMDAGFRQSTGTYVISLDADLQNDPSDIPKMFDTLKGRHLDVIAGWRTKRKDPVSVKVLTTISRVLRKKFINDGVHDSGCTLRIYTREAVKQLELWGEMHRYIIALLRWKGFRIGEMKVHHRRRYKGSGKYGIDKSVKGFTDLLYMWFINKYSRRPLHLFGLVSFIMFGAGMLIETYMLFMKIFFHRDLSSNGLFIVGFFFIIMAIQFFVSGVMIDLQLRNHFNNSSVDRRYVVRQVIAK